MITDYYKPSTPGPDYVVNVDPQSAFASCSCRGWIYNKAEPKKDCKHIRDLKARIAAGETIGGPAMATQPSLPRDGGGPVETARTRAMAASALPTECTLGRGEIDWRAVSQRYPESDFILEEKLDGIRILFRVADGRVTCWTRPRGSKDPGTKELPDVLKAALAHLPNIVGDGELVVPFVTEADGTIRPGTSSDVQHWLARAHRTDPNNPLRMRVFDMLEYTLPTDTEPTDMKRLPLTERREALELAVSHHTMREDVTEPLVTVVPWIRESFRAALDGIWARGGEGAIVKRARSIYVPNARSKDWVKLKREGAIDMTITGYEAGEFGPHSKVLARGHGIETSVKTKNADWLRRLAARPDYYIGKTIVIEFTERTPDGKLRHPRFEYIMGEPG